MDNLVQLAKNIANAYMSQRTLKGPNDYAYDIAKGIGKALIYNPDTKEVLPSSLYNQTSRLSKVAQPLLAQGKGVVQILTDPQYQKINEDLALSIAQAGMTGDINAVKGATNTMLAKKIASEQGDNVAYAIEEKIDDIAAKVGKDPKAMDDWGTLDEIKDRLAKKMEKPDDVRTATEILKLHGKDLGQPVTMPKKAVMPKVSAVDDTLDPLIQEAKRYKSADEMNKRAIKEYGTTNVPESAGFITPEGKLIDSSGKKQGSMSEGRNVDHREIAVYSIPEDSTTKGMSGSDALSYFMEKSGSTRISVMPDEVNVDTIGLLTKDQLSQVEKLSKGKTIYADISKPNGSVLKSGSFKTFTEYKNWLEKNAPKSQLTDLYTQATKGTGNYLYHGTGGSALKNITKEGLKPGRHTGNISLSPNESYAQNWAREEITPQGKIEGVTLRINQNLLKTKILPSKSGVKADQLNELISKDIIPPEAIEIYKNGKWQPLTQATKGAGNPAIKTALKSLK